MGKWGKFAFFFVLFFTFSSSYGQSLEELERIAAKAPTLEAFLKDSALINAYYDAAQKYYGGTDEFPRSRFDAILDQLRSFTQKLPDFKERAWETTGLGPSFQITNDVQNFGRSLNHRNWEKHLETWTKSLEPSYTKFSTFYPADWDQHMQALEQEIQAELNAFEQVLESQAKTKKEKLIARNEFYETQRKRPAIQELSKALVYRFLTSPKTKDVFSGENPDIMLTLFNTVKRNPQMLLEGLSQTAIPPTLFTELRNALPDIKDLTSETADLFPKKMKVSRRGLLVETENGGDAVYNFKAIPRRFHGIFKGIAVVKECVGGSPNFQLKNLSPERWGSVLLGGTHFQVVERDGKYLGFVQAVPLKHQDGTLAASVDFGSRTLNQGMSVRSEGGKAMWSPLSMAWIREAVKHKPDEWKGYLVSDSTAIDNSGAKAIIRTSPEYILASELRSTKEYSHIDPLGTKIPATFTRGGHAATYGGRMIIDGTIHDAGTLRLVKPVESTLYDVINTAFEKGDTEFVKKTLTNIHNSTYNPLTQKFDNLQFAKTLRESGLLPLLSRKNYVFHLPNDNGMYHQVNDLKSIGFSGRELNWLRQLCYTGKSGEETYFYHHYFEYVHDVEEFLEAVKPKEGADNNAKQAKANLALLFLGKFLSLDPTPEETLTMLKDISPWFNSASIATLLAPIIPKAKSAKEYLELTDFAKMGAANANNYLYLPLLITNTLPHFMKLNPTVDEMIAFHERLVGYKTSFGTNAHYYLNPLIAKVEPKLRSAWLEEVRNTTSPEAFTERLVKASEAKDVNQRGLLVEGVHKASKHLFSMDPGPDALRALREKLEPMRKNTEPAIWNAVVELSLMTSADSNEYLASFDPSKLAETRYKSKDMVDIMDRCTDRFFKFSPNPATINSFLSRIQWIPLSENSLEKVLDYGMSHAENADIFLTYLNHPQKAAPSMLAATERAAQNNLSRFLGFPPTIPELKKWVDSASSEKLVHILLDHVVGTTMVDTPSKYLEFVQQVLTSSNAHVTKIRQEWIEKTMGENFFRHEPTTKQIQDFSQWLGKTLPTVLPTVDAIYHEEIKKRLLATDSPENFAREVEKLVHPESGLPLEKTLRALNETKSHLDAMPDNRTVKAQIQHALPETGEAAKTAASSLQFATDATTFLDAFLKHGAKKPADLAKLFLEQSDRLLELNPSFEALHETFTKLPGLVDDATKRKLVATKLTHTQNNAEFLKGVETILPAMVAAKPVLPSLMDTTVADALPHFIGKEPTLPEILNLCRAVFNTDLVATLLEPVRDRHLATSVQNHLDVIEQVLRLPKNEANQELFNRLVRDPIYDGVLNRAPTPLELNRLASFLPDPRFEAVRTGIKASMTEYLTRWLESHPTSGGYVEALRHTLSTETPHLVETLLPAVKASTGKLVTLQPETTEVSHIRDILSSHSKPGSPSWEAGLYQRLVLARTPEEFLLTLQENWGKADTTAKALGRNLVDQAFNHFTSMAPTPGETERLLQMYPDGIISHQVGTRLLQRILGGAGSIFEYLEIAKRTYRPGDSDEYKGIRREAIGKTKKHFLSFEPNLKECQTLISHSDDGTVMMALLQNTLSEGKVTPSSAREFLDLIKPLKPQSGQVQSNERRDLILNSMDKLFFSRTPTFDELSELAGYLRDPENTKKLLERGAENIQRADQFVLYMQKMAKDVEPQNKPVYETFLKDRLARFEEMQPTSTNYRDLMLASRFVSPELFRTMAVHGFRKAAKASEFTNLGFFDGGSTEYNKITKELFKHYFPDFRSARPTKDEKKSAKGILGSGSYLRSCLAATLKISRPRLPAERKRK